MAQWCLTTLIEAGECILYIGPSSGQASASSMHTSLFYQSTRLSTSTWLTMTSSRSCGRGSSSRNTLMCTDNDTRSPEGTILMYTDKDNLSYFFLLLHQSCGSIMQCVRYLANPHTVIWNAYLNKWHVKLKPSDITFISWWYKDHEAGISDQDSGISEQR